MSFVKSTTQNIAFSVASIATLATTFFGNVKALAVDEFKIPTTAQRFQFTKIDDLIGTIALTLQYFSVGIAVIAIILNGIKVMTSSDSHRAMQEVKSGFFKIFIGCAIVFLASTVVSLFFKATN